MSDITASDHFVPRGAEEQEVEQIFADVRTQERDRRIIRKLSLWVAGVTYVSWMVIAGLFAGLYFHRPVPRPELAVAMIHDDGTYDPPALRADQTRSQRRVTLIYTLKQYIICREEYSDESVNRLYHTCSAMSAREEQERYQKPFLDERSPRNPYRLYGTGVNAGRVEVTNIKLQDDDLSPNAVNAYVTLRLTPPMTVGGGAAQPREVHRMVHITWDDPDTPVPMEIQQQYDPAGILIVHYSYFDDSDRGAR